MLLETCYVEDVVEPSVLIDIPVAGTSFTPQRQPLNFRSQKELYLYLNDNKYEESSCRWISISQRTSWSPLQATKSVLEAIAEEHDLGPSFWELPSCFYKRTQEVEEAFCLPYTQHTNGSSIEIAYSIKYPELKERDKSWAIRHSGIFHRYDASKRQSLYVLFSPNPRSQVHVAAEAAMLSTSLNERPFWLHEILFQTHISSWRRYIAAEDKNLLPIAKTMFTTYANEPVNHGYDTLSKLGGLENSFARINSILAATITVLDELSDLENAQEALERTSHPTRPNSSVLLRQPVCTFRNFRNQCAAYSRTATYLQRRAQKAAQLLIESMTFQDQDLAKRQNGSIVFISMLTLVYLPSSFVATFFGMNFFDMNNDQNSITANSTVWIFFAASALLSVVTFLLYRRQLKRRNKEPGTERRWRNMVDRMLARRIKVSEKNGIPKDMV